MIWWMQLWVGGLWVWQWSLYAFGLRFTRVYIIRPAMVRWVYDNRWSTTIFHHLMLDSNNATVVFCGGVQVTRNLSPPHSLYCVISILLDCKLGRNAKSRLLVVAWTLCEVVKYSTSEKPTNRCLPPSTKVYASWNAPEDENAVYTVNPL